MTLKRGLQNVIASVLAGLFFFLGWWLIIDVVAVYGPYVFNPAFHVFGIMGTISFFMINSVSFGELRGDVYVRVCFGCFGLMGARIIFRVGLLLGVINIIACCGILIANYIIPGVDNLYPGIALFLQNILILLASLIFRFGRSEVIRI
ncbi:transmembrane protein 50A-like [Artemia franciscana]|uniref:Uncharacterized protein n=1 Tax=Artemia franciscana TaxID=6661 RepID=A0AA88H846_ARTSF|nr:hypothetical protein QYM36_017804 [Artemia franciscana]